MVTVWQRSTIGELCWLGPQGPNGIPVVPLVWEELPCVALPLAHLDAVDTMTTGRAAFVVSGTEPARVASGRVDIRFDLRGARFTDRLLEQEIVKHPPTRLRADGLMARRENWWWVPRVLVTLVEADDVREVPVRSRAEDALLVRPSPPGSGAAGPRVDVVTAESWPAGAGGDVELWPRDGGSLHGEGTPAFAFGHQHSPDFERWERWYRSGTLDGEVLAVRSGTGTPAESAPPYGLLDRFRNHREVARACRAGIAAAEARQAGAGGAGG